MLVKKAGLNIQIIVLCMLLGGENVAISKIILEIRRIFKISIDSQYYSCQKKQNMVFKNVIPLQKKNEFDFAQQIYIKG